MTRTARGLFVGLITLDTIYLAEAPPAANQKCVADDFVLAAGGPASNAAVAFAELGGNAVLAGALGRHALAAVAGDELQGLGVRLADLMPDVPDVPGPPPLSSVVVSRASGERAVMSRNSMGRELSVAAIGEPRLRALLADADVLLVDGHQMALAQWLGRNKGNTPLVVDAGSWKPGFDAVIAAADYVIASANFHPPGYDDDAQVMTWLRQQGVLNAAISHGGGPIVYCGETGSGELMPQPVAVVDTLGAGDFLHGAFCYHCLRQPFADALAAAAAVASRSCTRFGTRAWLSATDEPDPG